VVVGAPLRIGRIKYAAASVIKSGTRIDVEESQDGFSVGRAARKGRKASAKNKSRKLR